MTDTCHIEGCDNDATHWGRMCDEHAKECSGIPTGAVNHNGEI